jgi:hypothetical protein
MLLGVGHDAGSPPVPPPCHMKQAPFSSNERRRSVTKRQVWSLYDIEFSGENMVPQGRIELPTPSLPRELTFGASG